MSQQPPQQQQQYYAPPPGAPPQGQQGQYPPPPGQPGQQQQYHQQPQQPQQQQPQQHHQQQQHHHQQQQQQHGAAPASASTTQSDSGSFNGGQYTVAHRDTNAILNVNLAQGASIKSKSGAMVHMSGTVQISGKAKFSVRKLISGGDMHESTYVGPGSLALGPTLFGDIITLHVDGRTNWNVGKDAYLASTPEVGKEAKSQGVGKALFSGEDLFVYKVFGQGLMWLTSFGAVDRLDLKQGEHHIVDNGHLVAWSCDYKIEKAGGGFMAGLKTGEGLVCRFTGPGTVYVQTRNMDEFQAFIRANSAAR